MFKNVYDYGVGLNSYDLLKLVALFTMIIDHLGAYFWPETEWLRALGRTAFPLFLFLVGYSGKWKVSWNLIAQGVAIILCAALTDHAIFAFNILITIAVTRAAMAYVTRYEMTSKFLLGVFVIAIVWWPAFLWLDYSTVAILFAVTGHLIRLKPHAWETRLFLYSTLVLHFLVEWKSFGFHTLSSLILLMVATAVTFCIKDFRIMPIEWLPKASNKFLLLAARNTLPVYTLHVMLFMVLEKMLFPARLLHFHWT